MKSIFDISDMKRAWQTMYRERTCPGQKILFSKEHAAEVAEHKKWCRFCNATSVEELELWQELATSLKRWAQKPEYPEPAEGQIWSLREELGGWDDIHQHINAPMVLILEMFDDVGGVRVAQVFDVPELHLGDDVELEGSLGYAQAWNTYAMRREDLEKCWGSVAGETVRSVRDLAAGDEDDAVLEEESVIFHFRELEMEVGARMALQALPDLVAREERNGLRESVGDAHQVAGKLLKLFPEVQVPDAEDPLLRVATTEFPEHAQKMAAAEAGELFPYNVLSVGELDFAAGRTGLARIDEQFLDGEGIHIEGKLDDAVADGVLLAWWKVDGGFQEGKVELDSEGVYFEIYFTGRTDRELQDGELILLLLRSSDEE